jgi:DNA-binding XRE family transcriptional regulator
VLGELLTASRAEVTAADAARALGVTRPTAQRWVRERRATRGEPVDGPIRADEVAALIDEHPPRWRHGRGSDGDRLGLSPTEAAEKLGVSRQRVVQLVTAGKLPRLADGSIDGGAVLERGALTKAARARSPRLSPEVIAEARSLAASLSGIERDVVSARYALDEGESSGEQHRRTTDEVAHLVGVSPITVVDVLRVVAERVGGLPGEPPPTRRRTRRR